MDKIYFLALIKFNTNAETWEDMRLVLANDVEHARNMINDYYIKIGENRPEIVVIRRTIL